MDNPTRDLRKAFGYLRVSGDGQVDGDGFTRQRVAIEKWAAANGVTIVRWFEERGVSGTILDRPAFSEMMVALMSNGVHTVLVEKLDRIARDIIVQETIVKNIQKQGFTLVSVMEPDLCIDDPSRKLMRQIMGAFSEYERDMIVLKTRAARQRIRKTGARCEGRKPYGTRDGEQAILQRMLNAHTFGSNFEELARELNGAGTLSRSGKPWRPATIRRILLAQKHSTHPSLGKSLSRTPHAPNP